MGTSGSDKINTADQGSCSNSYDWLDTVQDFTPASPNTSTQECPAREVCEEDPQQELMKVLAPVGEPVVSGIWQEGAFELAPRDEQNLKLAEAMLEDDLAYIKYDGSLNEPAELIEDKIIDLETLIFQARHGAPLDTETLLERAKKLHEQIGSLRELDSLSFADPSRLHTGELAPVKGSPLIEQLRADIATAIATDDDGLFEMAKVHFATLKKFVAHTETKLALAEVLRDQTPLAVRAGEVRLSLSFDECDAQANANPLYNTSETPCGHIKESAFYKALGEIRASDKKWFANIERGFDAIYSQNSGELLTEGSEDPYGRIEQAMAEETAAIEGAGFKEFFEKIAAVQYAASGAAEMADNKAKARQASALLEAYDNTSSMIDTVLWDNTQGVDRGQLAEALIDGLEKEATDIQRESAALAPLLEDELTKASYASLSSTGTPTPAQSTPAVSTQRYNAEDFSGSREEKGAPRPPGDYMIDGVDGYAQKTINALNELKYSNLTPEQKLERIKELIGELKAQRADLLRIRLAKEMSGLPNFRGDTEFFSDIDGNSDGAEVKKETEKFIASVEEEAFKSVLDSSLTELKAAKKDVQNGIYGVIDDHVSTAGYDDLIEKLGNAKLLLSEGKKDDAMAIYLTVHGSPKYTALMLRRAEQNGMETMAKELAINVAIVVASAGVAAVATAPFRAYAAARGMGQAATFVVGTSIEGAAFYASSETLQSAFTENGGWGSKNFDEHLFEGGMTVLMFGFLNGAMGMVKGLAKARVVAAVEARTGIKLGEAEAEVAFNVWLRQASVLKRVGYHTGAFASENVAFLAWENIKETVRQGLNDGELDLANVADKNLSEEAVYNQLLFLCLLKLGNFAAQPFIKPVVGIAQDLGLGEKATGYKALQTEGSAITHDMEAYYARTLARPATANRAEADALFARYVAFTQRRMAFIQDIPKEIVSGSAAKAAVSDATEAASFGDAQSLELRPAGRGVFKADAKTIESLKRTEQGVVDEGSGVYSWEIGPGKKVFIVQEIAGPSKPARSSTAPSRTQDTSANTDWMQSAQRYLKWAITLPAYMLVGAGGIGAPPPPPRAVRSQAKMPDYKRSFRIDTDRDMSRVLREVKEASHNGGAEHRIKIVIQGKNGVPADPFLAKDLTQYLPSQNGTHPVEYEVVLSDGSPYYEYRHSDGVATATTRDGRVEILMETLSSNDPVGDYLPDYVKDLDATNEVRINLGAKFPAETAIGQMSSMRHPKAVVVFDAGGREVYRQSKNGAARASFVANDPIRDCLSDLMASTGVAQEVHIELGSDFPVKTALEQISSKTYDKDVVIFDPSGREVYRQTKGGEASVSFVARNFEDVDKIVSIQLPADAKKGVVLGADVARSALQGSEAQRGLIGRLMKGDYDVTVETNSGNNKEGTAIDLFVKYPNLQEVSIRSEDTTATYKRDGLTREIDEAEAKEKAKSAIYLELTPKIKGAMRTAMAGDGWNRAELLKQKRLQDASLVNKATEPKCERDLRRLASRTTQEGQDLQELLEIFSDRDAGAGSKLNWMWLRALANMAEGPKGAEAFDEVVHNTLRIYKDAKNRGKRISGNVIEMFATANKIFLKGIGYSDASPLMLQDLNNKIQGSKGELATLEFLLSRPEISAIRVIPRSESGFDRTPDFEVTYTNSKGQSITEVWDVKTSQDTHKPVDHEQFNGYNQKEGVYQFRVIMIGGRLDPEAPIVIMPDEKHPRLNKPIVVNHVPDLNPSVGLMQKLIRLAI